MTEEKRTNLPVIYRRKEERRPSTLIRGYSRPVLSASLVYLQLIWFLLDRSGSMQDEGKAEAAYLATCEAVETLAETHNQDAFEVGILHYADEVEVAAPVQKATALAGHVPTLEPGGTTDIHRPIELARSLLMEPHLDPGGTYLRPVVVMMSDGQVTEGQPPEPAAEMLRQIADLVCIPFGSDADEGLLRRCASSPDHVVRIKHGRELKYYFAALSRAVTQSRRAGTDATKSIAALSRAFRST